VANPLTATKNFVPLAEQKDKIEKMKNSDETPLGFFCVKTINVLKKIFKKLRSNV
jgi:hypothetical protein